MKFNACLLFIVFIFSFYACEHIPQEDNVNQNASFDQNRSISSEIFMGIDFDGIEKSCLDMDDPFCSEEFTESDQYALDCQRNGDFAIQCACHDWICVDKNNLKIDNAPTKITGRNIDGKIDSCEPFDYRVDGQQVMCTTQFTEEDQFAIDCQANGYDVVQCGCHEFLCLE
jgi:hypothetical protein